MKAVITYSVRPAGRSDRQFEVFIHLGVKAPVACCPPVKAAPLVFPLTPVFNGSRSKQDVTFNSNTTFALCTVNSVVQFVPFLFWGGGFHDWGFASRNPRLYACFGASLCRRASSRLMLLLME